MDQNIPHNIMVRGGDNGVAYLFARGFENAQSIDPSGLQVAGQGKICLYKFVKIVISNIALQTISSNKVKHRQNTD